MTPDESIVMNRVRRALNRTGPPAPPPEIDESITRLTHPTDDLPAIFAGMCESNKMHVQTCNSADLAAQMIQFLSAENVKKVALCNGGIVVRLDLANHLTHAGFGSFTWDRLTLDELYDFDCAITDVYSAVAETGSLVVKASAEQGRALSLVPRIHIAIVEAKQILPDLIDLFAKLTREGLGSAVSLITGPSKTSDIEMTLVIGVHGPMKVKVFIVE